jgi:hypothetical protein
MNNVYKLTTILLMTWMLMGVSKCPVSEKYMSPKYQDCIIITEWSEEKKVDIGSLFCYDDRITKDNYNTTFVPQVLTKFNEHPLKDEINQYLIMNRDKILATHEYELPISYGRGDRSTTQKDAEDLIKWAETNRLERIRCEYEPK